MRKLKTILVALVVVASLYAASGTAWARTESGQRGTAWTDVGDTNVLAGPTGVSWEGLDF